MKNRTSGGDDALKIVSFKVSCSIHRNVSTNYWNGMFTANPDVRHC